MKIVSVLLGVLQGFEVDWRYLNLKLGKDFALFASQLCVL